jgi:hypothetical protein
MIEGDTAGRLDFGALRDAIERSDAGALLGFYAEDAELRVVNADTPNGPAFELLGRSEIEKYLRAVCDQGMTCAVEGESVDKGGITFGKRRRARRSTTRKEQKDDHRDEHTRT